MNRKEILEYIKYNGRYTKDVKKRLKKLLKKYHPDNNRNDKDTILVLYQIKKELEDGTLKKSDYSHSKSKSTKETNDNVDDSFTGYEFFIELIIKSLKNKRMMIDKKLKSLHDKMNNYYETINNKQDELCLIDTDIYELEKEISELLKIDIIDTTIASLILLILLIILFGKIYLLFITILFFVIIEIYYIYVRKRLYFERQDKLKQVKKIRRNVNKEYKLFKEKVTVLEKDELELKKDKRRINNDISYYNHQLSKAKDKELSKTKGYAYEKK